MAVVLDRGQREALYRFVVGDLHDLDGIARELADGNVGAAQALRRHFELVMRLLDVLGWAEQDEREHFRLTLEKSELQAVFTRLYQRAMLEIAEGMEIVQQLPIGEAVEAARVCSEVVRALQPDGQGRLYELPRRRREQS